MADHRLLAPRRIGVCGSSRDMTPAARAFCEALGRRLAHETRAVVVSGGAKKPSRDDAEIFSADWHIVRAVEVELRRAARPAVDARIETVAMADADPSETFRIGTVTTPRGRTSEARRFAFVRSVDALVAVGGSYGTRQELSLAFELGLDVLPVPCFEGAAAKVWADYEDELAEKLGLDDGTVARWKAAPRDGDLAALAAEMIDALLASMRRRCFVIMPFRDRHDALYEHGVVPALRRVGAVPIRLDHEALPGDVGAQIRGGLANCDYVIAVLDDLTPNVLYELGMAHALDKQTVLLNRQGAFTGHARREIPFDLTMQQRLEYDAVDHAMVERLVGVLEGLRRRPR